MVVNLKNKNAFVTMLSVKMLVRYAPFRFYEAQEAVLPGYALSCRLSVLCHISSVDQLSCCIETFSFRILSDNSSDLFCISLMSTVLKIFISLFE